MTAVSICRVCVQLLAREKYLSLMIEAGSRVNWAALEAGIADKIFFYYAPKVLGGLHLLPVAGGVGRRRRKDALVFERTAASTIGSDEFAVEAWTKRGRVMFTGIVEELGTVAAYEAHAAGARITVQCDTGAERSDHRREHRGERGLPARRRRFRRVPSQRIWLRRLWRAQISDRSSPARRSIWSGPSHR